MPYIYCPYCDQKIFIRADRYVEYGKHQSIHNKNRVMIDNNYKNKRDGVKNRNDKT